MPIFMGPVLFETQRSSIREEMVLKTTQD